jgi:hypothetical protein
MPIRPRPPGTAVVPMLSNGLPIRTQCKDHVFELGDAHRVDWGSGWLQFARCLVCCDDWLAPMSIEWYQEPADFEDVTKAITTLRAQRKAMSRSMSVLRRHRNILA